ncbi:hypothetical protein EI94DRAFT_1774510 [Lactarius quietus]|nr:hypothetical protein EI94DRAFT_1774510 [Lactarius quietus]
MPCNKTGEYLPQGTPPSPPPVWSPNDWALYHDHVDFELTEFLYTKVQMSGKSIDTLSQLWHASFINHGIHPNNINLFEWNDSLLATIDATPVGDVPWEGFSMSYDGPCPFDAPEWMTTTHNVWFCDPRQLVHNLLANQDFDGEFDYMLFQEFDTWKRRCWWDFMSGDWAWKEADIIANDPDTHGLLLVPIILGSDKTTVSIATGQNEYYPLYLSIGNVHNNVRHAHRNAVVLLGLLAIPKSKFCCQVFHSSLANILSSLRPAMTIPEVARTPDGHSHRIIYSLGPYIADYPEQALLACVVQGWCPRYAASPFTSEFPQADIHEIIAPDILHQVIKGTFKDHLMLWVELYLVHMHGKSNMSAILDDIDCCIALAPSFPGLRCFPQGRGFKQWTGNDSKVLMKVYLPSLEGHVPPDMIRAFRTFLDFCYLDALVLIQDALDCFNRYQDISLDIGVRLHGFSLAWQHSLCHYCHLICLFSAPNGHCTSITKSMHKESIKGLWRKSNKCHADVRAMSNRDILVTNQQQDKIAAAHSDFKA